MARQATLNVSLTPTLNGFVRAKVRTGAYESASEVIRESLRLFQALEKHEQSFWSDVREKVAFARRQVAEGRVVDGEEAMDAILAELDNEPVPGRKREGGDEVSPHARGETGHSRYRSSHSRLSAEPAKCAARRFASERQFGRLVKMPHLGHLREEIEDESARVIHVSGVLVI